MEALNTGNFGIDGLKVHVPAGEFEVSTLDSAHGWSIQRNSTPDKPEPDILTVNASTGELVYATKAYANLKGINYTIGEKGLFMQINPSKINHPYLLRGSEAIPEIEARIKEGADMIGLNYHAEKMALSRVDVCRQAELTQHPTQYDRAFNVLQGKRLRSVKEPNTHYFRNGQREVAFYGKRHELLSKGKEAYGCPERMLRCEAKFKTHKACAAALQITYLHQLREYENADLKSLYSGYIRENVFRVRDNGTQAIIPFEGLTGLLDLIASERQRSVLPTFVRTLGAEVILAQFVSLDNYREFLIDQGYERTTVWRHIQDVSTDIQRLHRLHEDMRPVSELVSELRERFTEAA